MSDSANPEQVVRSKLVAFQRRIAQLQGELSAQGEAARKDKRELLCGLLEIADAFEALDQLIAAKEEGFDKSAMKMASNVRAVHRKLMRLLKANSVVPMELAGARATMKCCKIVDTRHVEGTPEQTILAVVKTGYIEEQSGEVVRKAEVLTSSPA